MVRSPRQGSASSSSSAFTNRASNSTPRLPSSSSSRYQRSHSSDVPVKLTVGGRYDPLCVRHYLNSSSSNDDSGKNPFLIKATKHLAFMHWSIMQHSLGIYYKSPDERVFRNLHDACLHEMCRPVKEELGIRVNSPGREEQNEETEKIGKSVNQESKKIEPEEERSSSCRCCNYQGGSFANSPWFCSDNCRIIFNRLETLTWRRFDISNGFSWMLMLGDPRKPKSEQNPELLKAFDLLLYFGPTTGSRKLMEEVVFGSNSYLGFYTVLLTKNGIPASAINFRVHGRAIRALAEIPFAITAKDMRRQGALKSLMVGVEECLKNMDVTKLVLPSMDDVLAFWEEKMGFSQLAIDELERMMEENSITILDFNNTTLLQKDLH